MFGSKVIGVLRLKAPDSTEGIRAASPRMSFVLKINSFTVEVGVGFVMFRTPLIRVLCLLAHLLFKESIRTIIKTI